MGNIPSHLRTLKRRARRTSPAYKEVVRSSDEKLDDSNVSTRRNTSVSVPPTVLSVASSPEYDAFLQDYPHFTKSAAIDEFRARDFKRLDRNAVYLDYMGGGQYPESLIKEYAEILQNEVFGNTHSESTSSKLSEHHSQKARDAVLSFFDADPNEYAVVWTNNATAGLKLVGESFPFTDGSSLVLPVDGHNSVQGMRAFAKRAGADVRYVSCLKDGGYDLEEALVSWRSGLSNLTNHKVPLHAIVPAAHARGVHTILDAAALAPTTRISLTRVPVDAMVVSFYKMFGFPTGVGALIAKRSFLDVLERPWFAGGAVDFVQVPGTIATPASCISSRFEDGTLNYMTLPAISMGLSMLSEYIDLLPLRLSSLYHYLYTELSAIRYSETSMPVVQILSGKPPSPSTAPPHGYVIAFLLLNRKGDPVPLAHVEDLAARRNHGDLPAVAPVVGSTFKAPRGHAPEPELRTYPTCELSTAHTFALRTGCVCNPGGATSLLGIQPHMQMLEPGATHQTLEDVAGRELGVVRVSLGWVSNWSDVATFIAFVRGLQDIIE